MTLTAVSEEKYMSIRWFKAATPVPSYVLNYQKIKLMPHLANSVSTDLPDLHQPTKYRLLPTLQF
jgi:hypothetical protein